MDQRSDYSPTDMDGTHRVLRDFCAHRDTNLARRRDRLTGPLGFRPHLGIDIWQCFAIQQRGSSDKSPERGEKQTNVLAISYGYHFAGAPRGLNLVAS